MQVTQVGGPGAARRPQAASRAACGFALLTPAVIPPVPAGTGAVELGAMLAMQEVALQEAAGQEVMAPALRDRQARRHAEAVLAQLAALQCALLGDEPDLGDEPGTALARLSGLAETAPEAADPGLAAVLAAVTLRARIELARRQLS